MKQTDLKVKAALVLGLLLSVPIVQGWMDGTIPMSTALFRMAVGLALAYGGVVLVTSVVGGYLPEPEPEEEAVPELEGVEDAVLVEQDAPAAEVEQG